MNDHMRQARRKQLQIGGHTLQIGGGGGGGTHKFF